jgi:hypothetical protein
VFKQVLAAKEASGDSACSSSSSSSSSSRSSSGYSIFNRPKELGHLTHLCSNPPDSISVILGPISSGKTALFGEFMHPRSLLDSRCLINARETPI